MSSHPKENTSLIQNNLFDKITEPFHHVIYEIVVKRRGYPSKQDTVSKIKAEILEFEKTLQPKYTVSIFDKVNSKATPLDINFEDVFKCIEQHNLSQLRGVLSIHEETNSLVKLNDDEKQAIRFALTCWIQNKALISSEALHFSCQTYSQNTDSLMLLNKLYSKSGNNVIFNIFPKNIDLNVNLHGADDENAPVNRLACYLIMINATKHASLLNSLLPDSYAMLFHNVLKSTCVDEKVRINAQQYLSELMRTASNIDWTCQQTDSQWELVRVIRDAFLVHSPEMARGRLPTFYELLKMSPDQAKFQEWAKDCQTLHPSI